MKRLIGVFTIFALVFSVTLISTSEKALANNSLEEIKKEIEDLKKRNQSLSNQKDQTAQNKDQTQSEININREEQSRINNLIEQLDRKVEETNTKIRKKEEEITQTKEEIKKTEEEISQLKEEIEELKKRIAKREELLKDRLKSLQKNGGEISYLEVLLGAKNFGDFLNRASAVTKVMDQDKVIMEKHQAEKKSLEEKKNEVEQKKKELEERKTNLEQQKSDLVQLGSELDDQKAAKQELMKQLKVEEQELEEKKMELSEQEAILERQQSTIQKEINRAEQRAKEAKQQMSQGSSSNAGDFVRPADGPVTSGYGPRWGSTHFGIDLGRSGGGSDPIRAVADGTVLKSYYSSSYGNVVYVTHYINNQLYTTVYAHMQNREVSDGQSVEQGQRLGYMGSTGHSTGPHLHFELHKGSWNFNKSNAIDPSKLINF